MEEEAPLQEERGAMIVRRGDAIDVGPQEGKVPAERGQRRRALDFCVAQECAGPLGGWRTHWLSFLAKLRVGGRVPVNCSLFCPPWRWEFRQ